MKYLLFISAALLFKQSHAQITKNNWLVGGSGVFSSITYNSGAGGGGQRITNIQLSPNIGYFFVDKFTTGLRTSIGITRSKILNTPYYNLGKGITYGGGPFLRYYFLPTGSPFNILIDGNYQYSISKGGGISTSTPEPVDVPLTKYEMNTFSVAAGPVLYFNSSVGLEFLIGYSTTKYLHYEGRNNTIQAGIGLQVHLEKDK